MNTLYDKKALTKYILGLIALAVAMKVTGGSGFILLIPFILMALFASKHVTLFYYLLMIVAAIVGNSWVMPKNAIFAYAQRGLLVSLGLLLSLQIFGRRSSPLLKPLLLIILYCLSMIVSSIYGWNPKISLLKLFLFTMVFFAYYGISNRISLDVRSDSPKVRSVILSFSCFFIIGSVLLIPFPAISQLSGEEYVEAVKRGEMVGSLFKGMTMHSQSLGPCVAMIFTIIFADFVFSIRRMDKLYLSLLLCSPILIFKTSSRTAMGSLVIAVLIVVWLSLKERGIGVRWRSKIVSMVWVGIAIGALLVLAIPSMRQSALNFAAKRRILENGEKLTAEEVMSSRVGKWEEGINNFHKSPFVGNGFQVSEDMASMRTGLVLSAPIEKSIWVSAVLEEGGALGFTLFCIFVVGSYTLFVKRKAYIGAATFVVLMVTNLGEFTIFSMSYTGGLTWALVFAGLVLDAERNKEARRMMPYQSSFGM